MLLVHALLLRALLFVLRPCRCCRRREGVRPVQLVQPVKAKDKLAPSAVISPSRKKSPKRSPKGSPNASPAAAPR